MHYTISTTEVDAPRRFEYWQDVVCRHCIPASSDAPRRELFDAEISGRSVGALGISKMVGPEHRWVRDFADIRSGPEPNLWLSYMERGIGYLEQNGKTVIQRTGDMVLYDASRPFVYTIAPESFFIVRIPRELLQLRTTNAGNLVAMSLGPGTGFRAVLGAMIREACGATELERAPQAETRVAGSMLDLVSAIIDLHRGEEPAMSAQVALYRRALATIDENIEQPELDIDYIAARMRVSTRTLSRAFAAQATTPMKCIWQKRLEASYCALREGVARSVTEAAFTYGFCDVSHFSRSFKKHYGVTPLSVLLRR
jgi:AraC-like DNA-binding protein